MGGDEDSVRGGDRFISVKENLGVVMEEGAAVHLQVLFGGLVAGGLGGAVNVGREVGVSDHEERGANFEGDAHGVVVGATPGFGGDDQEAGGVDFSEYSYI